MTKKAITKETPLTLGLKRYTPWWEKNMKQTAKRRNCLKQLVI